jgi:hypothetical protein
MGVSMAVIGARLRYREGMSDLAAFISARLDEDEAVAKAAGAGSWHVPHLMNCGNDCPSPCPDAGKCHLGSVLTVATGEKRCLCTRVEGDDICIYDEGGHDEDQAEHIARHDPPRALREVEAKRAIIAAHRPWHDEVEPPDVRICSVCVSDKDGYPEQWVMDLWPCLPLRALAAVYSDHPDYDEAWSPDWERVSE